MVVNDGDKMHLDRLQQLAIGAVKAMAEEAFRVRDQHAARIDALSKMPEPTASPVPQIDDSEREAEVQHLRMRHDAMLKQIEGFRKGLDESVSKNAYAALQARAEDFEKALHARAAECEELRKTSNELSVQLAGAREAALDIEANLDDTEKRELKERVLKYVLELDRLKRINDVLTKENLALTKALTEADARVQGLRESLEAFMGPHHG